MGIVTVNAVTSPAFSVTDTGELTAQLGTIAGWSITDSSIYKGILSLNSTTNSEGLILKQPNIVENIDRLKIGNFVDIDPENFINI